MFKGNFCVLLLAAVVAEGSDPAVASPNPGAHPSEQTMAMPGMNMMDTDRGSRFLLPLSCSRTHREPQG